MWTEVTCFFFPQEGIFYLCNLRSVLVYILPNMVSAQRKWFGLTILMAAIGVGLIVAAFTTDHWIVSEPRGNSTNQNTTGGTASRYTANITFGLFTGYRAVDFGLGKRTQNLILKCDLSESVCAYADKDFPEKDLQNMINSYKNQTAGILLPSTPV